MKMCEELSSRTVDFVNGSRRDHAFEDRFPLGVVVNELERSLLGLGVGLDFLVQGRARAPASLAASW